MVARKEQNLKPTQHHPDVVKNYDRDYEMAFAGHERRNAAWETRQAGKVAIKAAELTEKDRRPNEDREQGTVLDPTEHIIGYINEQEDYNNQQDVGNQRGPVYDRAREIARGNKARLMTAEGRGEVEQGLKEQAEMEDKAADEKEEEVRSRALDDTREDGVV